MTKIFLDSGDPAETREVIKLLGAGANPMQLDGQTTNPTLVAKNPYAAQRFASGEKFSKQELLEFYKKLIQDVAQLIPHGSVSIEVYADATTTADEMIAQAREMWTWIGNAHIKLPTTAEGLHAAHELVNSGMRVNMTLCFSQVQAAAVYAATQGAKKGDVFLSPFIGRLDDIGQNGIELIANILKMYESGDGHVEVLTASVRSVEHFQAALALKSDIITAPFKVLKEWAEIKLDKENSAATQNLAETPDFQFTYQPANLQAIAYEELDLSQPWTSFNLHHDLTDQGIARFTEDWNKLVG